MTLRWAIPDVDAVYVGLPNHLHHEATQSAARSGRAILSEKSLTVTVLRRRSPSMTPSMPSTTRSGSSSGRWRPVTSKRRGRARASTTPFA